MRFALSAEHEQFAGSLDRLLSESDTPSVIRAWGAGDQRPGLRLWAQLAEIGVIGLLAPDRFGGLDAEPIDMVVACERLGYHAVPGPLVESMAAIPLLLPEIADGACAERFLSRICSGEILATLSHSPHVPFALDADIAGLVLHADETSVHSSEAEPAVMSSVDKSRRLFATSAVRALDTEAGASISRAFDFAVLACAAQLLGAGQWLLDTATAHVKQRKQYGREIGQFQAIKHLLADVTTSLELARPLLHGAAVTLSTSPVSPEIRGRDVSAAKVAAADAAYLAARTCLQVHGAVGYTAEHDLGLWLTKVRALLGAWGPQAHHRTRVASALGISGQGMSAPDMSARSPLEHGVRA